jgi:hypothetical protein
MAIRQWSDSFSIGKNAEREFFSYAYEANWFVGSLDGDFHDEHGAPVGYLKTEDGVRKIKAPDRFMSKPLLPHVVVEIKAKAPVQSDGMFWLDDARWDYLNEWAHLNSSIGLISFKYPNNPDEKPLSYDQVDLGKWVCATIEHLASRIEAHERGGNSRSGAAQWVYKFKPASFSPLTEFLHGDVRTGSRYNVYLNGASI